MSDIYVDDIGKGFPFVFVHGYLGSSEMWCFQKNYFSKYCRVIAPALPGFGESYSAKSLNQFMYCSSPLSIGKSGSKPIFGEEIKTCKR